MVVRGVFLYILLGHLFIVAAGSLCVPELFLCLICNTTEETQADPCELCLNRSAPCTSDIPQNCKKAFQVSINSTGSTIKEGDDITLTCLHDLPGSIVTFGWKRNGDEIEEGRNKSELAYKKVLSSQAGRYVCYVDSPCGHYESSPHDVTIKNEIVVVLVVCGVSALLLVLIMGLGMKLKLKRDNAKHKERMRQKAELEQRSHPAAFTPRES